MRASGGGRQRARGRGGERDVPGAGQVALTKASLHACTRFMRVVYVSSVHGMGSRWWEDSAGVTMEEQ